MTQKCNIILDHVNISGCENESGGTVTCKAAKRQENNRDECRAHVQIFVECDYFGIGQDEDIYIQV